MNIFILDPKPEIAAIMQCDKHVVKMVLETAQLLSTAHHELSETHGYSVDKDELYKRTHKNHPCAIWVRTCPENYDWTYHHLIALLDEYTHRYGRTHKTSRLVFILRNNPFGGVVGDPIDAVSYSAPKCMPDDLKKDGVVESYRSLYNEEKYKIAKWAKTRPQPKWFKPNLK